jgi:hypothetical protein
MNINSLEKPRRSVIGRIAKYLLSALCAGVVIALAASWIWSYSGSNQWEFLAEKDGVKGYTLKAPGVDLEQVKGVIRVRTTLSRLVKFMQDPTVCDDIGCVESRMIERVDDQVQYYYFRFEMPPPLETREFVVKAQFHQDPRTKQVVLEFDATPDKVPADPCCFRVTKMNNTWKFTPVGNGEIEIEYIVNMDEAGVLPKFMINSEHRGLVFDALPMIEEWANRDKYKDASYDFVKEI